MVVDARVDGAGDCVVVSPEGEGDSSGCIGGGDGAKADAEVCERAEGVFLECADEFSPDSADGVSLERADEVSLAVPTLFALRKALPPFYDNTGSELGSIVYTSSDFVLVGLMTSTST